MSFRKILNEKFEKTCIRKTYKEIFSVIVAIISVA